MILLNDFKRQWADTREEAIRAFEEVGASGWYILGKEVEAFESALAGYWGLPYCIGVASGLDAIEIGLKVLQCGPGERVLTTPLSAFATTLAVVKTGAIPVFVDCDETGLMDLDLARQALRDAPGIRFFLPVHLYGHRLNQDRLREFLSEFDLRIVEDCAQSIDAGMGLVGQAAATSFYPTKNLGAMGDGGALLTRDAAVLEQARQLRDYGQSAKYRHDSIGYNSRLDELQAALLRRVYLPRLERWTARRREIAARYISGITHTGVRVLARQASCWHLFPVSVDPDRKPDFMAYLRSRSVSAGEHYPTLIPDQRAMAAVRHEIVGRLTRARWLSRSEVSLPIHAYLANEEVDHVIEVVNSWGG